METAFAIGAAPFAAPSFEPVRVFAAWSFVAVLLWTLLLVFLTAACGSS
jgi:hypothetical protein